MPDRPQSSDFEAVRAPRAVRDDALPFNASGPGSRPLSDTACAGLGGRAAQGSRRAVPMPSAVTATRSVRRPPHCKAQCGGGRRRTDGRGYRRRTPRRHHKMRQAMLRRAQTSGGENQGISVLARRRILEFVASFLSHPISSELNFKDKEDLDAKPPVGSEARTMEYWEKEIGMAKRHHSGEKQLEAGKQLAKIGVQLSSQEVAGNGQGGEVLFRPINSGFFAFLQRRVLSS